MGDFMPLTILVSGVLEYDSGKTWLSIGLGLLARRKGLRVALYKPVAGHNLWNRFSSVIESKKRQILLGNDVLLYERYLGSLGPLEAVNPIDLLTVYPDLLMLRGYSEYLLAISSLERSLALARITSCDENIVSRHFIFNENIVSAPLSARTELVELAKLLRAESANPKEFLEFLSSEKASLMLERCRRYISTDKDVVIIESFSDSLLPYGGVEHAVDLLLVVAPGKVLVFTGEKLRQAIELLNDINIRTGSLLSVARHSSYLVLDAPLAESPIRLADKLENTELARLLT